MCDRVGVEIALLRQDLRNAARNLASWRKQADSPFVRDRIAYWRAEADRLLDRLNVRHR